MNSPGPPQSQNPSSTPHIHISNEEKQIHAWHYYGYAGLAEWMASSRDFLVLRRYAPLTVRSLLYLQHKIAKMERSLEEMDNQSRGRPYGEAGLDSLDNDEIPQRQKLMEELVPLLQRYYDLINSFSPVNRTPTARPHHLKNLRDWFATFPEAIDIREQHFLQPERERDLFPVFVKEKSPLRIWLEKSRSLRFLFTVDPGTRFTAEGTTYHSDTGFDTFISILIVVAGLCLLFGPMWWLSYVSRSKYRLAIITSFVSVFSGWLWAAAGQRPFEILAATAAYAAVLMVFIQIGAGS